MSSDLQTVFTAASEFEAETVAAVLRDEGIDVAVFPCVSNAMGISLGSTGNSRAICGVPAFGVPVQVRESDLPRARTILKEAKVIAESVDWDTVDVGSADEEVIRMGAFPPLLRSAGGALVRIGWVMAVAALLIVLITMLMALAGCAYRLEGRAVEGSFDSAATVPAGSSPMGSPVPGARIQLWRDPDSLGRSLAAETSSGSDGAFVLEVPSFGAGWLEEEWSLRVTRSGYRGLEQRFRLPMNPSSMRLEVILTAGKSSGFRDRDGGDAIRRQADQFGAGSAIDP